MGSSFLLFAKLSNSDGVKLFTHASPNSKGHIKCYKKYFYTSMPINN